jgi:hypothetical protein
VKQDASIGTNILRVSASDEDADNNGAIVYTLSAPYNPSDLEYFEIQQESGWIVLRKPLDVSDHHSGWFVVVVIFLSLLHTYMSSENIMKYMKCVNKIVSVFLRQGVHVCS